MTSDTTKQAADSDRSAATSNSASSSGSGSEQRRLGIDLGGTKIEAILLDAGNRVIARERVATPAGDYDAIVATIAGLADRLDPGRQLPAGIGTPGAVSRSSGLMQNSNSTCLNGRPLQDDLQAVLGRPVRIANDADCFTLSEARDGAGQGAAGVFGVILGTGVGGGLFTNGALVSGLNGIAGEWGHNRVAGEVTPPGRACYCGRLDCVETWLSGPGLARSYALESGRRLDVPQIIAARQAGDTAAAAVLSRYVDTLAASLAVVINIFDPDVIVLGGGVSNMTSLYEALPDRLAAHVFSDHVATRILPAIHGDASGVRGAAWLWL